MKRMSNAGFSLVELMVVVAIIGILAAVAIPNFTKFQRRARAAEGRALLSAIYDGEKSAYASYEGYSDNFGLIGFKPEGNQLRTNGGFATDNTVNPVSTGAGQINAAALAGVPAAQAVGSIIKYCPLAGGVDGCKTLPGLIGAVTGAPAGTAISNAAGAESFTAATATDCGGGAATADGWTITNGKVITQVTDCTTM